MIPTTSLPDKPLPHAGWIGPHFKSDLLRLARRGRGFGLRVGYILFLLLTLYLLFLLMFPKAESEQAGSSFLPWASLGDMSRFGERVGSILLLWQCLVLLFIAPPFFTAAILEERQRRTLELLLTTHLHDREIILGILLSRVTYLMGFWLAGFPVLAIAQAWGGISLTHMVMASAATTLLLIMMGGISLTVAIFSLSSTTSLLATYTISATPIFCLLHYTFNTNVVLHLFELMAASLLAVVVAAASLWLAIRRLRPETLRESEWADPTDMRPLSYDDEPFTLSEPVVQAIPIVDGVQVEDESHSLGAVPPLLVPPIRSNRALADEPVAHAAASLEVIDYQPPMQAPAETYRDHLYSSEPSVPHLPPLSGDPLIWKETYLVRSHFNAPIQILMSLSLSILFGFVLLTWFFLLIYRFTEYGRVTGGIGNASRSLFLIYYFVFLAWTCLDLSFITARSLVSEVEKRTLISLLMLPQKREWLLFCKGLSAFLRHKNRFVLLGFNWLVLMLIGIAYPWNVLMHATTVIMHFVLIACVCLWISSRVTRITWAYRLTSLFLVGFFFLTPLFSIWKRSAGDSLIDYCLIGWNPVYAWWITLHVNPMNSLAPFTTSSLISIVKALWTMLLISIGLCLLARSNLSKAGARDGN